MARVRIGERWVGAGEPTYFIADIGSNHEGQLDRAVKLVHLAAESGADAAKFQHFRAATLVSARGFEVLGGRESHQAAWKKSVYEVYEDAEIPWEWTETLKRTCEEAKIEFLSAPYDFGAVDMLEPFLTAYKVGSGDITWIEELEYIARKGKPVIVATGASDLADVQRAVGAILAINPHLVLMQCNTNYTGDRENFRHLHLNVLRTYAAMYPDVVLGLSDHTHGHAAVMGAVALGARAIEKHFTDDRRREGPDHGFALDPPAWREMVERTRELESALGNGNKVVQPNERQTVVGQRRCLRAAHDLAAGAVIARDGIDVLRPAPPDAIFPHAIASVVGRRLGRPLARGDHFRWTDLE